MNESEPLIDDYLEHECALMREDMIILTLEKEIRARKIKRARFKALVDKDKNKLKALLNNAQRKEVVQQVVNRGRLIAGVVVDEMELKSKIGDSSWLVEPVASADVIFDFGPYEKPNVAVSYPWEDRPVVIINIVRSVERDPNNLSDPFILAAIHRYWDRVASRSPSQLKKPDASTVDFEKEIISLTPAEAERKLKRILGAVIAGAKSRARRASQHQSEIESYLDWLDSDFDDAYFEMLSTILKEKEIKRCEKHKTNWKSRIAVRLLQVKPVVDHQPVLAFLSAGKLPRHMTGPSLRNAFFAYNREIKSRTFSKYKSQGLKWKRSRAIDLRSKYDLTDLDKAMERIATEEGDRILLHLGIARIDSYVDVRSSNLVWEEGLPTGSAVGQTVSRETLK